MTVVIVAGSVWALLALPVGMLVGRGMRTADDTTEAQFGIDGVERFLREHASTRQR